MVMDRQLIEKFAAGGDEVRAAIAGLSKSQLQSRCEPGLWSIQEVVIHLADSDAIAIDRMKRMLTEDNPTQLNADETAYVDLLHPHEQSLDDALTLLDVGRRQFARVLRQLPDAAFDRIATHELGGERTLAKMIASYTNHLSHHLQFIREKRAKLEGRS
jgi:uncharacterized damage-inducible protein DinB